jgi:hypothetical protein
MEAMAIKDQDRVAFFGGARELRIRRTQCLLDFETAGAEVNGADPTSGFELKHRFQSTRLTLEMSGGCRRAQRAGSLPLD